jgi:cobaltochelatase CobN
MFLKSSVAGLLMVLLSVSPRAAGSEPAKVAIVVGEFGSRAIVEGVGMLYAEHDALRQEAALQIYTPRGLSGEALKAIGNSRLVLILHHPMDEREDRRLAEQLTPQLEKAAKGGATVYGTSEHLFPKGYDAHRFVVDQGMGRYFSGGGAVNVKNGLLHVMTKALGIKATVAEPLRTPRPRLAFGLYERRSHLSSGDHAQYLQAYRQARPGFSPRAPWIGIVFMGYGKSGESGLLDTLANAFEEAGFNVLAAYGYPSEKAIEQFFLDEQGKSRVRLVVAMGLKMGVRTDVAVPLLGRVGVPVINAITSYSKSEAEWRRSPAGLDLFERSWTVAQPELAGAIQPIVVGSHEAVVDPKTGLTYYEELGIPSRVTMLVQRVKRWIALQDKPNKEKRVAILYYNYPPGKHGIGASYLNVLPESLWQVLSRLKAEGYNVDGMPATKRELQDAVVAQRNIGPWAPGELDRMVARGNVTRIDLPQYTQWGAQLPEAFRQAVLKAWGPSGQGSPMTSQDLQGGKFFVLPTLRYGNILLTPQSGRGGGGGRSDSASYHDPKTPPHQQYVALYLYLHHGFQADAIVHFGTHGTHEWLPGKEAGLADEDPPEALIGDMPNIYPYLVDNVGEGIQAKRRGQAVIIDHMTPPLDKAGLDPELQQLTGLVNDYGVAKGQSLPLADVKREEIDRRAAKKGLLRDLGLKKIQTAEDVEALEHYLKSILEKVVPFGLHTLGVAPVEKSRRATAEAVLATQAPMTAEERQRQMADLDARILQGAKRELDSFIAALAGKYIPAGTGNDPIRSPQSLPTGKNFYALDPNRIPSPESYAMGAKLAGELLADYQHKHGQEPDKLAFTLWAVETIRHEGVVESQILNLLGARPKWDRGGRVTGVEPIPRKELAHPRVDVVVTPSGLYRDVFPNLMTWIDEAVSLARDQDEMDNLVRAHILMAAKALRARGVPADRAQRMASVRLFTPPSGVYGAGMGLVPDSQSWKDETQVAAGYFRHNGFLYGQGFWGESPREKATGETDLGQDLFKQALSGTKLAVHSMSSNVVGTIDNDDFYEYLGGTALAVRTLDGKSPELYVTDMSRPKQPQQTSLARVVGQEMRTRYLNPKWIDRMTAEGYAGARYISEVVENLWGWQVTAPEVVGDEKWQELYETYVEDKHGLHIKEAFRKSGNPWAHQVVMARMLEAVRKNYWKPDQKVVETIARAYAENAVEHGMACASQTCNNPQLVAMTESTLKSVPGLEPLAQKFTATVQSVKAHTPEKRSPPQPPAPGVQSAPKSGETKPIAQKPAAVQPAPQGVREAVPAKPAAKPVEGFQMEEVKGGGRPSAPIPYWFLGGFLLFIVLLVLGWQRR